MSALNLRFFELKSSKTVLKIGFGDKVSGGYHVGCAELLTTIRERVLPKYHIFGEFLAFFLFKQNHDL